MTDDTCNATLNNGEPCVYAAKYADGKCGIHTDKTEDGDPGGRPSKLEEYEEDILQAAREGLTYEGIARVAGVGVSTLRGWRDDHEEFSAALERARAKAERELIAEADSEFVLERSYGYVKTERLEADVNQTTEREMGDAEREIALEAIRSLQSGDDE